jgi:glycosyltransferase involved in cell wall biosynthesis
MDSSQQPKPSMSLFFPVYNDEATVRRVTEKSIKILSEIASEYEIVIVNDGSPDRSGEIADELAAEYPCVSVIHHETNLGYGKALQSGFERACKHEWICFTDGDDEYDVGELRHIAKILRHYDVVITFRYCKAYSTWRMFVSAVYNVLLRFIFNSAYRDISCGMKLVRRDVVDTVKITSASPFVGAEIVLQCMLKGYSIGEVGISTYPRQFGISTSTSWRNITATIKDMLRFHKKIFRNSPRPEIDTSDVKAIAQGETPAAEPKKA